MVVGVIAGGYPALVRSVEGAEDDVNAGIGEMDARRVGPDDVVVGIAASGTTPFVRAALSRAQTLGARSVLVTCAEPAAGAGPDVDQAPAGAERSLDEVDGTGDLFARASYRQGDAGILGTDEIDDLE